MVDSGNLLGALWSLQQGLDELVSVPVLNLRVFEGLKDTVRILNEVQGPAAAASVYGEAFRKVMGLLADPPLRIGDQVRLLRELAEPTEALCETSNDPEDEMIEDTYWSRQVQKQCSSWLSVADSMLKWIDILDEFQDDELALPALGALQQYRKNLVSAPSLRDLAHGVEPIREVLLILIAGCGIIFVLINLNIQ